MTESQTKSREEAVLDVRDLKLHFKVDAGILKAVDGVSFELKKGKTLGLVGESGCGKSITSKAVIGINEKHCSTTGEIMLRTGEEETVDLLKLGPKSKAIRAIRGGKVSMIFQEPMAAFSPMYTIGNQIMEMIRTHRTKDKKEAKAIALEMLTKVGIANADKRFNQYPHEFSGGMMQRAMIAMALSNRPEILIADEPTTALDVTIQAQVLELMRDLQQEFGMSILFITHDLGTVAEMCDEVAVMYLGKIVEQAPVEELFRNPKHPYTRGLMRSIPTIGVRGRKLDSIEGTVPVPLNLPPKCGFYDRCRDRIPGVCDQRDVPIRAIAEDHQVRCFLYEDEHRDKGDTNG